MRYDTEFAAGSAMTPLDPPLFIGAEPFVLGAVLLALIAIGVFGWLVGNHMAKFRGKATNAIWTAVDVATRAAMQANTEALPAEAADLRRVIQDRLGQTLAFAGALGGRVKTLDTALKGEADDHSPSPKSTTTGTGPEVSRTAERDGSAAAAAATASVTIVTVHPQTAHPVPAAAADKPAKRQMNTDERNNALRLAVVAFNDHWRHQTLREDEINAVVRELCDPGPKPMTRPGSGAHH